MHTDRHSPAREERAHRILDDIRAIPNGRVSTYGDLNPVAPRVVGHVLATAPHDVPWHRVVRADGTVAMGSAQLARLVDEGFRPAEIGLIWRPPDGFSPPHHDQSSRNSRR